MIKDFHGYDSDSECSAWPIIDTNRPHDFRVYMDQTPVSSIPVPHPSPSIIMTCSRCGTTYVMALDTFRWYQVKFNPSPLEEVIKREERQKRRKLLDKKKQNP